MAAPPPPPPAPPLARPWHFVHNGEAQGPVSGEGLVQLALQGVVGESTLVWSGGDAWVPLSAVPELLAAVQDAEERQPAPKRRRLGGAGPPPPEVLAEVPAWVEGLDAGSTVTLFERALFHHLADAIKGHPALRDELLTAYVKRHPASDDRDPAAYAFSDEFLLDAVDDFESQEQMWEVLGAGNEAAVRGLIAAAARCDRRYCAQLQNLALLSRARRLIAAGNAAAALEQLLREEPALALARDLDGRSLWHDLAAGEHADLLRRLLPVAAAEAAAGQPQGEPAQQPQPQQDGGGGQPEGQRAGAPANQVSPVNLTDLHGNTPLHLAAQAASVEVAQLLVDAGAMLDMQNRDPSKYAGGSWIVRSRDLDFAVPVPSLHQTPLHIAAEAGDLELMRLLVGRGALLDLRDTSGSTPLHLALEAQDERAVELLLQAGASPTATNNDMAEGATCLTLAAGMGRPGILRLLLGSGALGAAVNQAEAEQGFTPLMLAARRGNAECVQLLLAAGADAAAVNHSGKTALQIAEVNKRAAAVELLQAAAAQPAA